MKKTIWHQISEGKNISSGGARTHENETRPEEICVPQSQSARKKLSHLDPTLVNLNEEYTECLVQERVLKVLLVIPLKKPPLCHVLTKKYITDQSIPPCEECCGSCSCGETVSTAGKSNKGNQLDNHLPNQLWNQLSE